MKREAASVTFMKYHYRFVAGDCFTRRCRSNKFGMDLSRVRNDVKDEPAGSYTLPS